MNVKVILLGGFAFYLATWIGICNLPDSVWIWRAVEALAMYVLVDAALARVAHRWAPGARNT
jgi:hypothetical protein